MVVSMQKVAIFGASGNFGTPITAALISAGFNVTAITRNESTATFPSEVSVVRVDYTLAELTTALVNQDAAVCVVGPAGMIHQATMAEAAEAAGIKRFIIDDFGWGPDFRGLPEFDAIKGDRTAGWDRAAKLSKENPEFTWSGITTGNPIDWALKRFPSMGFNVSERSAIIYDAGTEYFSGTTLQGIGQAVVGVLKHPDETANRFLKVRSINTCQNELLEAFQSTTKSEWSVQRSTTKELLDNGREKRAEGNRGWILELVVAQLYDLGEARCVVAASRAESDADLLGVKEETPQTIASGVMTSL